MQTLYRKLFEVQWHHDYFLIPGVVVRYPDFYNIQRMVKVFPDNQTVRLLNQHRMLFKDTPMGFVVLIEAQDLGAGKFATKVDLDPDSKFTFCWSLEDRTFVNYTNCRVNESEDAIYYFSNRTGTAIGTDVYLNKSLVPFGTPYNNQPAYWLGDMMVLGGKVYEAIEQTVPLINFAANAAKWQEVGSTVINYVNPADRMIRKGTRFVYNRPNTKPGEVITMQLLDTNGNAIQLGDQLTYRSSLNASEPVNIVLNLEQLEQGPYKLIVQELPAATQHPFYYANPMLSPFLAGAFDFFTTGAPPALTFCTKDLVTKRWILDNPNKTFMIRFRNRLTHWQYLRQDQTIFDQPPDPRPLTWFYSRYTVAGPMGTTIPMPDPTPDRIITEIDPVSQLVKNIYSKIYLAK
ncbi:hypothetical protein DVR12_24125 [Chitinophaga silvatica]|uniref:Uncharacterized protein n=1 Tax=Chitinophaga silvatica TaxID=2282649 RepID=A0A3E1Y3W7_9BACT|nr:hypothetical protein [Chitinophaga silvatica]RFS19322.1 hypothetical protein DVR12_24125 [Chitinophaga silvatica]